MWRIETHARVFLALGTTDMRNGIYGLAAIVEQDLGGKALNGDLYVFCNRGRDTLKIIYWQLNGFCLWQKKLNKDRFRWPDTEGDVREIRRHELAWLLDGLDISQAHKKKVYERVV